MIVYEAKWGNKKKTLFRSRSVRSAPVPPFYTAKNQCISYLIQRGERKYFLDTVYKYFEGKKIQIDDVQLTSVSQNILFFSNFNLKLEWTIPRTHIGQILNFLQNYKQLSFLSHRTRLLYTKI